MGGSIYEFRLLKLYTACKRCIQRFIFVRKKNISYKIFTGMVALRYYGACDESAIKCGYRFFRNYYISHPLTGNRAEKKLTFKELKKLLDFDTRKEKLTNILKHGYHYYHFSQTVRLENDTTQDKIFLIIEANPKVIESLYNVLIESFNELFSNIFSGFKGITIIFSNNKQFEIFLSHIKKELVSTNNSTKTTDSNNSNCGT